MRGTSTVDFSGIVIDRKELSPRKSWYPPSSDLEDGDVVPYPEAADSDQYFWQKTTKDPNVDPYAKRIPQVHKEIQITSGGSISSVSTSDSTPKTHTSDSTEDKDNDDSPTGRIGNTPFGKLLYALGVLLSLIFILLVAIIIVKSGSSEDEVVTSADSASSPTTSQTSPTFPTIVEPTPVTDSPTYHPTVKITDQPTMNPTTSLPTLSPTTHPPTKSPTLSPTVSEEGIIEFIKSQSAMSSEYLEDNSSPQSRALEWLLSEPSTFTLFNSKEWKVLQRWAMAVLYYSTGGELWWDSSDWLTSVDECQWSMGDTESRICDDEGRILQLSLRFNNLAGTLPDELVLLSDSLVHLYLDNGIIQGSFPSAYAQLTKLETLFLQSNLLTGTLPEELNSLESLEVMSFGGNKFITGNIPSTWTKLENLRILNLSDNELRGTIPPELSKMKRLSSILLQKNKLTGTVPPELGKLKELRYLYLETNRFDGTMPSEVCKLKGDRLSTLVVECDEVECTCDCICK